MMTADRLHQYRQSIDNIDAALVYLLAERFKVTQAVGRYKAENALPPADPAREEAQIALVEAYAKAQGLWHDTDSADYVEPVYSEYLELDLSTVVPSIAGPKRPQDRVVLSQSKAAWNAALPSD